MLVIKIEGQPLYIAKKTSLQLEVNNSAFSVNRIEGDIVFTFDVPAAENDLIFGLARFVYVQRCKKYACTVSVDGVEIAAGDLYIQKSTSTSYSCGLVINPFPENFAENKLSQNDYGADRIISNSAEWHKIGWWNMLANSLIEDAIIKFPLFIDTVFYGSANRDFGWYLLPSDPTPPGSQSGFQASINTNDSVGLDRCYVNRLFTTNPTGVGGVIEELAGNRGIRMFNNNALNNPNSFAFAPAIQLLWILEKVIKNGGYQMIGNFQHESNIKKIYSQSLRALDGLASQSESAGSAKATLTISPACTYDDEDWNSRIMPFEVGGAEYFYIKAPATQNYQITVSIRTYLPANLLNSWALGEADLIAKEALMFFFIDGGDQFPNWILWSGTDEWNGRVGYMRSGNWSYFESFYKIYNLSQLQSQIGYNGAGFYTFNYTFTQRLTGGRYYCFFFGKLKMHSSATLQSNRIDEYTKIELINQPETVYKICNVFANRIKYAEHMPALTNSDFISKICNAFGLCMFIDSAKGQIELSFFKDILSQAQAIDLTQYLLNKKSYIEKYEPKKYRYKFDAVKSEDIDELKVLPPVKSSSQLPDAFRNFGKICLVENENRYRIAVRAGDSVQNWVFRWDPYSGNNQVLEIGEGDAEDIVPLKVPNMKIADERITNKNFLLNIEVGGCSPIFGTGNKEFDMVLVNYLGRKKLTSGNYYYEHAAPVCMDVNGNREQGVDLTATGNNSVGEMYAAPWLNFLAYHERVCHYFLLPVSVFMEVLQLLKPQDIPINQQIRLVIIDSVKLMPIKMNFQFTEGSRNVIAEIVFAKEKVEL